MEKTNKKATKKKDVSKKQQEEKEFKKNKVVKEEKEEEKIVVEEDDIEEVEEKEEKENQKNKEKDKKKKEPKEKKEKVGIFKSIINFFKGVKTEMGKVIWPNKRDMIKYSVATIVFIVFFALYFFGIEILMAWLKDNIINI